jgi:hypothetical protein
MSHTPEPWETEQVNWRGELVEHDWYIFGDAQVYEDDEREGISCTGIAVVIGNKTAGDTPRHNAERIVSCVNACKGLTDEQVKAIPRLVKWFAGHPSDFERHEDWVLECSEIETLFP